MATNEWDVVQSEPDIDNPPDPFEVVAQEPYEPTWTERIAEEIRKREFVKPAQDAAMENLVKPFARGVLRTRVLGNVAAGDISEAADLSRRIDENWAPNAESQATSQRISDAPTLGVAAGEYVENPGMAVQVAAESLPQSVPSLALAGAGTVGGFLLAGPPGAVAGGASGMAAGSFATEYLSSLLEVAQQRGIDLADESQLAAAFADKKFMAEARERGVKRGVPIAAFDALSMGVAGRIYKVAKAGGLTGKVVGTAAETGVQAGLGMAGEAGAQLAADGGITNRGDIVSEGIGEVVPGAIEAGINAGAGALQTRQGAAGAAQSRTRGGGPPPGGSAGGGTPGSPDIPTGAYPDPGRPVGPEGQLAAPPEYHGPKNQPRPTYADEGQPVYPGDATAEERHWFDVMWERTRERREGAGPTEERRGFTERPPDDRGGGGGAPSEFDVVATEPDATFEPDSTGTGSPAVPPAVLPARSAASVPVEPLALPAPAANVQPTDATSAAPVPTNAREEFAQRKQASEWRRSASGGVERDITSREIEIPAFVSTQELVNGIDPAQLLAGPQGRGTDVATRPDGGTHSPERVRHAIVEEAMNRQRADREKLDESIRSWASATATDEVGREDSRAYVKRYLELLEGANSDRGVMRARAVLKQRDDELSTGSMLTGWDVKHAEAAGHAENLPQQTIVKKYRKGKKAGQFKELTTYVHHHFQIRMRDGRVVGQLRSNPRDRREYKFRADKGLDKQLATELEARWGKAWEPRDDGMAIANFIRDWESGKRPKVTIEGEATEIPGRTVDWRASPEQTEQLRQRLLSRTQKAEEPAPANAREEFEQRKAKGSSVDHAAELAKSRQELERLDQKAGIDANQRARDSVIDSRDMRSRKKIASRVQGELVGAQSGQRKKLERTIAYHEQQLAAQQKKAATSWDFVLTWPMPTKEALRELGPDRVPTTEEQSDELHTELRNEWADRYTVLQGLKEELESGFDEGGMSVKKKPITAQRAQHDIESYTKTRDEQIAAEDEYESIFGAKAAEAFRKVIRGDLASEGFKDLPRLTDAVPTWNEVKGAAADFAAKKTAAAKPLLTESRTGHKRLICAMCSGTKDAADGKIPAEERYAPGAVVSAMAKLPQHLRPDMLFLSAEFGLIEHSTPIPHYEKKLTKTEADRLIKNKRARDRFLATAAQYKGGELLIAAGGDYRRVFEAWVDAGTDAKVWAPNDIQIEFAPAEIGEMRGAIKAFAIAGQKYGAHKHFAEKQLTKGQRTKTPISVTAKRSVYRDAVVQLVSELVENGGMSYTKDEHDRITGRTSSVNPPWAQELLATEKGMTVAKLKAAAKKLQAGEALGEPEKRALNAVLEVVRDERQVAAAQGWRRLRNERVEREMDSLADQIMTAAERGREEEADRAQARLMRLMRRNPYVFGVNEGGEIYRVERPVEAAPWQDGRVLKRNHSDLNKAERKAFASFLKGRKDRARILKMLEQHAGTPWAAQAIEGIFTRQAMLELMAGREPGFVSALDDPRFARTRWNLGRGEEGLRTLLEKNGFLSEASKPVNNVSSSFVNCRPSDDCAKYCYATGGNYRFANSIIKAELVTLAVEIDPTWAAKRIAAEYKATREFEDRKALRLFDKGDLGEGWIELVKALNGHGVRVQIFSRRPELLRQIPDTNVRMLSIDASNERLADEHPDLPVAYIYSGKDQVPAIAKLHARGQVQVILPIKQGREVLRKENVLELRAAVKGIAPYICPIDAGYKKIGGGAGLWNCTKCDHKGGLGCFYGQPTKSIIAQAYPAQRDNYADLVELRRLLNEYAGTDGSADAAAGSAGAGRASRLPQQIDALLARLMAEHEPRREAGGDRQGDGGARSEDGPDGAEPDGVREGAVSYRDADRWGSSLLETIGTAKLIKGTGPQWLGYLKNQPGVKPEELTDTGFEEAILEEKGVLSMEDVFGMAATMRVVPSETVLWGTAHSDDEQQVDIDTLAQHGLRLEQDDDGRPLLAYAGSLTPVEKEDYDEFPEEVRIAWDRLAGSSSNKALALAKYADYTVEGGEGYFELLITVPVLPAEQKRQALNVKQKEQSAAIRKPIFEKWNQKIREARLAADNWMLARTPPASLPEGYELRDDAENKMLTLVLPEDAEAPQRHSLYENEPDRQHGRAAHMAYAWLHLSESYERQRDEEAREALDAAGVSGDPDTGALVYKTGHFAEHAQNVVVHLRAKVRTDLEGRKVLAVEEVQSDLHKQGRKHGYRTPGAAAEADRAYREFSRRQRRVRELLKQEDNLGYDSAQQALPDLQWGWEDPEKIPGDWEMSAELRNAVLEMRRATLAWKKADRASKDDAPPDAPFKKSYNLVALKRALRWAAENGYDAVAWTPGHVQGARYNALSYFDEIILTAGTGDFVRIEARRKGESKTTDVRTVQRDQVADWIGGDLAKRGLEQLDAKKAAPAGPSALEQDYERALREKGITERDDVAGAWNTPVGVLTHIEFATELRREFGADEAARLGNLARTLRNARGRRTSMHSVTLNAENTPVGQYKGYVDLYEKVLPQEVGKFVKRWGGKVGKVTMHGSFFTERPVGTWPKDLEWPGLYLTPEMKAGLLKPIAVYEQRDLFGLTPGRDRARNATPAVQQDDLFGPLGIDPVTVGRQLDLEAAKLDKERRLRGDKSVPADIGRPGDLFTRQKDLVDAAAKVPERPGTNAKQRALRAGSVEWLARRAGGAHRGVQILGTNLPREFVDHGTANLLGREVTSLEELALLAQIYRNPAFETLRWLAVKDGKVIHEVGITSRLAGAVRFDNSGVEALVELHDKMTEAGADGWYMLHNHPSGDPTPSPEDITFTRSLARKVPKFLGHVIVDHDRYGVIDQQLNDNAFPLPAGTHKQTYASGDEQPLVPHALLGQRVDSPLRMAQAAKHLTGPSAEIVTILGTSGVNRVRAIFNIPLAQLRGARGIALLRRLNRTTGSRRFLAIVHSQDQLVSLKPLLDNGVLADAMGLKDASTYSGLNPHAFTGHNLSVRSARETHGGRNQMASKRVSEGELEPLETGKGTLHANPLMPVYRAYQRRAQAVIDRWNDKIGWMWDPLGKLPRKENYLTLRYEALGKLTKVREVARQVYDTLAAATPADAQAVYDYLTTAGATTAGITDAAIARKAKAVKKLIDRIGRTLVMRGMLSPQAYARYKDAYLPRLYLKHVLEEGQFAALGAGRRLSDLGYLKRRKNLTLDERVLLGEILDPAFLASHGVAKPMRDLAIVDFLNALSPQADWVAPQSMVTWRGRRVSAFWLKHEADSLRQRAELYGPQNKAFAQGVANQMDAAANAALQQLANVSDEFKELPDSPRYGILRGAWVRKEIHDDLVGAMRALPSDAPAVARIFEHGGWGSKLTQWWKQSKVALNPPAQIRNFLSNIVLVHISGVALARIPVLYGRAIRELATHGKYWRIARKYGLFESTFTHTELVRIEEEWLDLQRRMGSGNTFSLLKAMGGVMANRASDVYQLSESIGKIAKLIDGMEQDGLSESEAMIEAHKWLFDYSLVPKTVSYLRNAPIGVPFVTFYYKATARLAEAVVKHPARFLPYVVLGSMMSAMVKELWDIDDDEAEKLREAMPNWIRERAHVWIMPWKDDQGRWQVLDFGYLLPWGVHVEVGKAAAEGDVKKVGELLGLTNGPIPAILVAWKTGVDPFTKKPIFPEHASSKDQLFALLDYTWSLVAPPFVTSHGWLGKTYGALTDRVNPRTGDPELNLGQAMLRLAGINVYPVDPSETRQKNIQFAIREIEAVQQEMGKRLRDRNLTREEKEEVRSVYREIIRQKQEDLRTYKEASQFPRRLMAPEPPKSKEPAA